MSMRKRKKSKNQKPLSTIQEKKAAHMEITSLLSVEHITKFCFVASKVIVFFCYQMTSY